MDLWIRSKNRNVLTKIGCLSLEEQKDKKYSILNHSGFNFYQYLGSYDYERALEILDEIQELIKPEMLVTEYKNEIKEDKDKLSFDLVMTPNEEKVEIIQPVTVVYEMPEE